MHNLKQYILAIVTGLIFGSALVLVTGCTNNPYYDAATIQQIINQTANTAATQAVMKGKCTTC